MAPIDAASACGVLAGPPERAIVVLGCAVSLDAFGRLRPGALSRRLDAAANAYRALGEGALVVASGGRRWRGAVEADVMARELAHRGVPGVVRERCSLSTQDNARFTAVLLGRRGVTHALVVTCAWHMRRAVALFGRAGMVVDPLPVHDERSVPLRRRAWRRAREGFLSLTYRLDAVPMPGALEGPSPTRS